MSVKETVESAEWKPVEVRPHELISERAQGAVKMQLASDCAKRVKMTMCHCAVLECCAFSSVHNPCRCCRVGSRL